MTMKKIMMAIGVCLGAAVVLAACARSDGQSSAGSGAAATGNGSGTVSGQDAGAGTGAGAGTVDAAAGTGGEVGNDGAPSLDMVDSSGTGQEAGGENGGDTQEVSPDTTYDAVNQAGDEPVDTAGLDEEGWDGTFANASGETLTVTTDGEYSLSFSFAQSGLSGSASVQENQASFSGDDGVTVYLENLGGSVEVSVINAEGTEEASAISGSYMRQ